MTATRVLSVHARYGCRDSGACCTAGWPIPIEADRLARAEAAAAAEPLAALPRPLFLRPAGSPPEAPAVLAQRDRACVFYRHVGPARCALHRALGHDALPLACRQFPRISVIDPRGASVTLSHFCPTAAALLATDEPLEIVENAPAFPVGGEYVGLDVRDAVPPALRPDMLMDWESWWRLESEAIALLASQTDPEQAMARLFRAVELTRTWSPGAHSLTARVMTAFETARTTTVPAVTCSAFETMATRVLESVPDDFLVEAHAALARRSTTTAPRAHVHFLAAHAFANWAAHLGDDLRHWWRSIEAAHVLVSGGLHVRDVDLLLRHYAEGTSGTWGTWGT